jgi:hypothetical protein
MFNPTFVGIGRFNAQKIVRVDALSTQCADSQLLQLQPHGEQLPAHARGRRPVQIGTERTDFGQELVHLRARGRARLPYLTDTAAPEPTATAALIARTQ